MYEQIRFGSLHSGGTNCGMFVVTPCYSSLLSEAVKRASDSTYLRKKRITSFTERGLGLQPEELVYSACIIHEAYVQNSAP